MDHLASLDDPTGYCMDAGSRLPEPMRCEVDAYLATRAPLKLLSELVTMLKRGGDILLPVSFIEFAGHPQQRAHQQQALAAYAAALVTNPTKTAQVDVEGEGAAAAAGETATKKATSKAGSSQQPPTSTTADSGETTTSSGENTGSSDSTLVGDTSSSAPPNTTSTVGGGGSSGAAAAALLWGVRAAQQLATFGLADGMHYNVELMTNLTLYVCLTAIRSLREKGMPLNMSTIAHTPQMDIIQSLVLNLDNEGGWVL